MHSMLFLLLELVLHQIVELAQSTQGTMEKIDKILVKKVLNKIFLLFASSW